MNSYLIMGESCKWEEREASNARTAYGLVSCWYSPKTRVAVMDKATGQTSIFTRTLDANGNLITVNEV